jgi:predicted RNA methylase
VASATRAWTLAEPAPHPYLHRYDAVPELTALVDAEATTLGAGEEAAPGGLRWGAAPPDPRGAFVLGGGRVLASGPPGGPVSPAHPELSPIRVARGSFKQSGNPATHLARIGWRTGRGRPGCRHELYPTPVGWWLIETTGAQPFVDPDLPRRYSTSLPSRLARAVVNLVARPGDLVEDPVCGAGILLVEAARIGCRIRGGDLNPRACHHARENLAALGLEGEVRAADATRPPESRADVVVGDLPYGRRLAPTDLGPLLTAIPARAERWALVADRDLSDALTDAGHPPARVIPIPKWTFSRFVHLGGV